MAISYTGEASNDSQQFLALAHPLRLTILNNLLAAERAGVKLNLLDAVKPYSPPRSSISLHVNQLHSAGLIQREKIGKNVFLRLNKEAFKQIQTYIEQFAY